MNSWLIPVGYTMCGALLAMMLMGIAFSAFMPSLDRWNRGFFISFFSLLFLALMPIPLLLHCCGENIKQSALLRVGIALWGVFWLLHLVGQYTDIFYYIAPDHLYVRGKLFPLLIAPLAAIMLFTIGALIKKRKKLTKRIYVALLVYLLPTAALILLYMFAPVDILISFWMVLSAQTMFGLILTDSMEQYMRQQQEIARQRAGIMVLQMRPHFIYNTMMTIYYLCKQDADKAQQVTLDFTEYLRKNFTAIASESTVPFTEELKHTQAYLAVEQAQHEDNLFVQFDTPHTRFRVPPLTLQPIVENAVKHGLDPDGDPLHIFVKTRQTNNHSEIIVENNGAGFDPAANNDEPHIALNNIRQRLQMMCGGELTIAPRNGGGTVVKVTIPLQNPEAVQE